MPFIIKHTMAFKHVLLCFMFTLLVKVLVATSPVLQIQQFLHDYSGGVRLETAPAIAQASLFNSLLQYLPTEPHQYAGQCNVTYDALVYTENRFAMLLPPSTCLIEASQLPPVLDIWQAFQQEYEVGVNFLLVSWANWFLADLFMAYNNTNGTFSALGAPLSLGNLYGRSPDRETALRSFVDGKMKVFIFNGEYYPPRLSTIQQEFPNFTMDMQAGPSGMSSASFFALGDPRFNMHVGLTYWSTQFLRLHNSLCDMLLRNDPELSDQQMYETARLIVSHIVVKFIWEEFIGKAVAPFRDYAGLTYDPSALRTLGYPKVANTPYFELNQLFGMHALTPDVVNLRGGMPFLSLLFQPQMLLQARLDDITQAFMNTSAGRMSAKNIPGYLWPSVQETLLDARAQRLQGFNAYRAAVGLPKFTKFEDFGLSTGLTDSLRTLYNGQIDDVEWYVGLVIEEPHAPDAFLPETMLLYAATFSLSAVLNLNLVNNPTLWETERLTPAGKAFIQDTTLASFLGVQQEVPFIRPDRQPSWHTVESLSGWGWHNLVCFMGYDYTIAPFYTSGPYFHTIFTTALVCAMAVIFAFVAAHLFWMVLGQRTLYPQLPSEKRVIATMHTIFAGLLLGQLGPYTYYLLQLLFMPGLVDHMGDVYILPFACLVLHGVMYIVEATTRVVIRRNQFLLWHHMLFFVFIFVASLKQSVFALKLGLLIDYFVCWEFALYMALLAHRLQAPRLVQQLLLVIAFITYGVSRLAQAVLVVAIFIYSKGRMQDQLAVYSVMLLLTAVLVFLQTYTFYIYWGIWKQASAKREHAPGHRSSSPSSYPSMDFVVDVELGNASKCSKLTSISA